MLYPDYLTIHCGLFIHKKFYYQFLKNIYKIVREQECINRGNPVFSKNVVAIEYGTNKKIFISLKKRDEFISAIKTRIDHGQT